VQIHDVIIKGIKIQTLFRQVKPEDLEIALVRTLGKKYHCPLLVEINCRAILEGNLSVSFKISQEVHFWAYAQ